MAEDSILHVLASAGAGLASFLATTLTTVRSHTKRLNELDITVIGLRTELASLLAKAGRAIDVEQTIPTLVRTAVDADIENKMRRIARRVLEEEGNRRAARASRPDIGSVRGTTMSEQQLTERIDAAVRRELTRELENIRRELADLKEQTERALEIAQGAATEEALADFMKAEAERTSQMHRTLGQIEGMLGTVRDGLGLRGRSHG